jgi:hypothetical protein
MIEDDKKLMAVYEKMYFPNTFDKQKYIIKNIIFNFIFKIENIFAKIKNFFKPKIKSDLLSTKNDVIHIPDPKNERFIENHEVATIYSDLFFSTEGKYNKKNYMLDLFAIYLKRKQKKNPKTPITNQILK